MNRSFLTLTALGVAFSVAASVCAQDSIPREITTPDHAQSKIGNLDFLDGYPSRETAQKIRDELDYLHGCLLYTSDAADDL